MVLVDVNAGPEQRGGGLLDRAFTRGADQRGAINQFFDDPQRTQEIDEVVGVGLDKALRGIGNQLENRSRQEAFARARSGNVGGSFQAGQQAGISAAALTGAASASGAADAQRFGLQQLLGNQRQSELLNSFGLDPFTQQSIQAILQGQNVSASGSEAAFALSQQQRQQEAFANDELSRAFGNLLNIGGNLFETDQLAKAFGRQGVIPNRAPAEFEGAV